MARIRNNNFVQLKRFFRDNKIPYNILSACNSLIVPLPEPFEFPSLLFRFDPEYPNRLIVKKLPLDGTDVSFEAIGIYQILHQLIRFKLVDAEKIKKLKLRGVNYFPGQILDDPPMKVSRKRNNAA